MKKITLLLKAIMLLGSFMTYAQTARLQVIHNSPDLAAQTVDVYVNGNMFINDFQFRTATDFKTVPAGVPLTIDIAPGNSTSVAQSLYDVTVTLTSGETYIAIANGIISPTGYTNPNSFGLNVFAQGREAANDPTKTDVLVNHGSPDAPVVDVVETSVPAGTIVNDIAFPNFAGYLELPNLDFTLDVRDASGTTTVATYLAPLQTLNLDGAAITVVASGFLNPTNNSNGPAFGLWVATAAGGALIPLLPPSLGINDLSADVVKIYPNPANTLVNIEIPFNYNSAKVALLDMNGRTVLNVNSQINTIDVSALTEGIYLLSLQLDDTVINKKIVIAN